MAYSPRQWELRDADAIKQLRIPTEDERRAALVEACRTFKLALMRRLHELGEHGHPSDRTPELTDLGLTLLAVHVIQSQGVGLNGVADQFRARLFEAVDQSRASRT
jgi:hypothetical protein